MADSLETTSAIDLVERPFAYAYRYPSYPPEGSTVIRFGTQGREINGAKPIEAIPLYTADTITRLQAALEAVKAYYIDANPTKLTEAYVCDLVCDAISGRGVTP